MDAASILAEVRDALRGELGAGYSAIAAFVEIQGQLLAEQAEFIARHRASGELNDRMFAILAKGLEDNTRNLANSVAMLTALTLEKAWNAVAEALWGGMRTILSAAGVSSELLPATPPHV